MLVFPKDTNQVCRSLSSSVAFCIDIYRKHTHRTLVSFYRRYLVLSFLSNTALLWSHALRIHSTAPCNTREQPGWSHCSPSIHRHTTSVYKEAKIISCWKEYGPQPHVCVFVLFMYSLIICTPCRLRQTTRSNLLGDDSARPLLEAISGSPSLTKLDLSRNLVSLAKKQPIP